MITKYDLTEDAQKEVDELKKQNAHPDISERKKQENDWAIETYHMVGRKKPPYEPINWENGIYEYMAVHKNHITPNDLID
ncbi:hypothetical protein PDK06_28415 [Bacillus cereus group sp. TH217LC]|uniref:hypothetical protein n=1 Tax=Bacillus cereus group sp. TH217LC TaxID=3018051 RepID=UPI0022E9307D|nr:hypothetical protein [Bacillus cereus group sp. TH217LC]MDA1598695.1 hypothetical protein [Bacillus cereus group sp. TH217LC]